jgi:iron(II)-dependent oxidoreductase
MITPHTSSTSGNTDYLRHTLEQWLDRWQTWQQLPAPELLRDGLFLLQDGEELSDEQRALLLRAALFYDKGIITALRHQTDPERTALLLCEKLLASEKAQIFADLKTWLRRDPYSYEWKDYLHTELLAANQTASTEQQQHIANLLKALSGGEVKIEPKPSQTTSTDDWLLTESVPRFKPLRSYLLVFVLIAAGVIFALWQPWQAQATQGMAAVTYIAGVDELGAVRNSARQYTFYMDRNEVTNSEYRRCLAANACPWPANNSSATRADYFLDPLYASHPVVNVDANAAQRYCQWLDKRLPTRLEWEAAAGLAQATGRRYRYPWGDQFEPLFVTSGALDTSEVGLHRPAGSSPAGLDDMAGNVAEWSASPGLQDPTKQIVKGGSYRDGVDALAVTANLELAPDTAQTWLGFRCAKDSRDSYESEQTRL